MPNKSPIQWTDFTSNPIYAERIEDGKRGWACTAVSPACDRCYSEAMNKRFGTGLPYSKESEAKIRFVLSERELGETILLDKRLGRKGEKKRMFVCDMTDVFHHLVTDQMLNECFDVWEDLENITVQVLTKRVDRAASYLQRRWKTGPKRIWIGATVESQEYAWRAMKLLRIPAAVRFLSVEPMLGPIDLTAIKYRICDEDSTIQPIMGNLIECNALEGSYIHGRVGYGTGHIDQIVMGGESGHGARTTQGAWVKDLIRQCRKYGRSVFVKQLGAAYSDEVNGIAGKSLKVPREATPLISHRLKDAAGGDITEWPKDLQIREFPEVAR